MEVENITHGTKIKIFMILSGSSSKRLVKFKIPMPKSTLIVQIRDFLKVFSGKDILYISIIPIIPVNITFIVEYLFSDMPNNKYIVTDTKIDNTIDSAAGRDLFRMFLNKLPFILSRLLSSASTKDGIPIVRPLMSVI